MINKQVELTTKGSGHLIPLSLFKLGQAFQQIHFSRAPYLPPSGATFTFPTQEIQLNTSLISSDPYCYEPLSPS